MEYGEMEHGDDDDVVATGSCPNSLPLDEIRKDCFYEEMNNDDDSNHHATSCILQPRMNKHTQYKNIEPDKQTKTIWCWWCCHSFKTTRVMIPTRHDPRRDKWHLFGVFCSASCAKAYAHKEFKNGDIGCRMELFTKLMKIYYKFPLPIVPAPPRQALKVFGGYLTIAQFRKANQSTISDVSLPPHDPFACIVSVKQIHRPDIGPTRTRTIPPPPCVNKEGTTSTTTVNPHKLARKEHFKVSILDTMNITVTKK